MKKKLIGIAFSLAFCLWPAYTALATETFVPYYEFAPTNIQSVVYNYSELASTNEIRLLVNGSVLNYDQPPIIDSGRTLVPCAFCLKHSAHRSTGTLRR